MSRLQWRRATETPGHLQGALIVVNGQISLDVYIFNAKLGCFCTPTFYVKETVELRIKQREVEAWLAIGDIPKPAWASERRENVPSKQQPALPRANDKR